MSSGVYIWSQTAATNANADTAVNWAEGQAPSSLNDSARAMMASVAKYRDDTAGAILTAGTSTAYTASSFQVFDSFAHMNNATIGLFMHATNGAGPVTLNVDGLGAKPLRCGAGDLPAGMLIAGTPYFVTYYLGIDSFLLQQFFDSPYNIPVGAGIDYWGTTTPSSSFAFAQGQAISRTTYSRLFALFGTTYGAGDGSTTFNLPDKRGRVSAALDAGAGRFSLGSLGQAKGEENHTLAAAEMAPHTHSGTTGTESNDHTHTFSGTTGTDSPDHSHGYTAPNASSGTTPGGGFNIVGTTSATNTGGASARHAHAYSGTTSGISTTHTHSFTTDTGAGVFGGSHNNAQPTIMCNYIIRII